jgi:hypothetical protein
LLPLDKLPASPFADHTEDDGSLRARLQRLEQLLYSLEPAGPRPGANSGATTQSLVSSRLHPMSVEVERRLETEEWDAVDSLTVRLMLDELVASVRACRGIAVDSSRRLRDVQSGLKEAERVLAREIDRESADRANRESTN